MCGGGVLDALSEKCMHHSLGVAMRTTCKHDIMTANDIIIIIIEQGEILL